MARTPAEVERAKDEALATGLRCCATGRSGRPWASLLRLARHLQVIDGQVVLAILADVEDARVGSAIRTVRLRRGLRQRDVSALAGISQATVSLVERGHLAGLTVETIRAVARALDVWLPFEPRWRGAELPRLLDERHADLVGRVVGELKRLGWEVRVEYSFNSWGERGSVDVLGLAPARRALLVVEVKTQVVDVQDLLSKLDRKRRVVPAVVSANLGWRPAVVGSLLVLPEETRARAAVARHTAVFEVAMPSRNVAVKRWLADPAGPLAGVRFLRYSSPSSGRRAGGGATRVGRPSQAQLRASPGSRAAGPANGRSVDD